MPPLVAAIGGEVVAGGEIGSLVAVEDVAHERP